MTRSSYIRMIFVVLLCLAASLLCSPNGNDRLFIENISNRSNLRILIFGNSITGAPDSIGNWENGWGLAASSPQTDYVHVLYNYFKDSLKYGPELITFDLRYFERNFPAYDFTRLDTLKHFGADLIIFRIGDNIDPNMAVESYLWEKFAALLDYITINKDQVIVCTSCWYTKKTVDAIMREVCIKKQVSFVDINYLFNDKSNQASSERSISDPGVGSHPGDKGMREIANALWRVIVQML